jgi:dTDP-4-dehydrorhamnose reductase
MKTILITGASGFLGWRLCQFARETYSVCGTFNLHPPRVAGIQSRKIDLNQFRDAKKLFLDVQPDAVIHAAAATQPNFCETHPDKAFSINVTASENLAGLAFDQQIPFVLVSTDLVFDGKNPPYSEASPPNPVNQYGEQKLQAEEKVRLRHPGAVICRLPLLYGFSETAGPNFSVQMIRSLQAGKKLRLFHDEIRTPADTDSVSRGLLMAVDLIEPVLHLGGPRPVSRYEMGEELRQILHASPALLESISRQDMPMSAPRPKDVSLDSRKAFALGYRPLDIREGFRRMADMMGIGTGPHQ